MKLNFFTFVSMYKRNYPYISHDQIQTSSPNKLSWIPIFSWRVPPARENIYMKPSFLSNEVTGENCMFAKQQLILVYEIVDKTFY